MDMEKRIKELEALAKRSKDQDKELEQLRAKIAAKSEREAEAIRRAEELEAQNAELQRKADIAEIASKYGVSDELRTKALEDGDTTPEVFMRSILDEQAKKTPHIDVKGTPNAEEMRTEMVDVIAAKMGAGDVNIEKNTFRNARMSDLAQKLTGGTGYMDNIEVVERAMTTTDLPLLLVEGGNRVLSQNFDAQKPTYKEWVEEFDFNDFRVGKDITVTGGGRLDALSEDGELTEATIGENGETYQGKSFGNKFVITREALINDDLGAFGALASEFAIRAANTANGRVYDLLQELNDFDTYKLSDGKKIFHASHNNSQDLALDSGSLPLAMIMMRRQKDARNNALNINPAYLIVAPDIQFDAAKLLNSAASVEDDENSNVYNPFYKSMKLIVDAELQDGQWYLAANRRTVKVGYLGGTGRKPVLKLNETTLVRTTFEGIFDLSVSAADFRGLVKGKA